MINLTELAITILVVIAGEKIQEKYGPDELELHLSNGTVSYVVINKKYSCPKNCAAKHYHETIISNDNSDSNYKIHYDSSNLKLNNLDVLDIYEIKNKKNKKNNEKSPIREKIEMSYFINKFNL